MLTYSSKPVRWFDHLNAVIKREEQKHIVHQKLYSYKNHFDFYNLFYPLLRRFAMPLIQGIADVLNQYTKGFNEWKVGELQSIFKKAFPPFGLAEGKIFKEYDLIHILDRTMLWGARNVDGRGFATEENRPTNLQIPLIKK